MRPCDSPSATLQRGYRAVSDPRRHRRDRLSGKTEEVVMKKVLVMLFVIGLLGAAVGVGGASASGTRPGCGSVGILHTGC
jgi:hypothetical protein